jgi:stage II sporulation protein AA (anti-sigma F factor antagonist)
MNINDFSLYVKLEGDMDQLTSNNLRIKLNEAIVKYKIKNLVLNLKNVNFIDSSCIGVIIGRYSQIKNNGGIIYLCELNEKLYRIIQLSGLTKICVIKDTEESVRWNLEVKKYA